MGKPIEYYAICWNNLSNEYIISTNLINDINIIIIICIFVSTFVNYSYGSKNDIIWILSASNQRSSYYDNIYSFDINSNYDYHCYSTSDNSNTYFVNGDKFYKIYSYNIDDNINYSGLQIPSTSKKVDYLIPINIRNDFSVGTSETTSIAMDKQIISFFHDNNSFDQWLAGVIDANGKIGINKKNDVYIEIVTFIEDIKILRYIQSKVGGNIKYLINENMVQYRMLNDVGIVDISNRIKNFIRNYERIQQFQLILHKFGIQFDQYSSITINSKWFTGYFDAKGYVISTMDNPIIKDLSIQVVSDNIRDLQPFYQIFGGKIEKIQSSNYFKWFTINKQQNILFYNYYIKNIRQFQTNKAMRLYLIPEFYKVKIQNPHFKNKYVSKSWETFNLK